MGLQRFQRRSRHIIFPGSLRKEIARVKAKMITHADEPSRSFFASRCANRQTFKDRKRQCKTGALQKSAAA